MNHSGAAECQRTLEASTMSNVFSESVENPKIEEGQARLVTRNLAHVHCALCAATPGAGTRLRFISA